MNQESMAPLLEEVTQSMQHLSERLHALDDRIFDLYQRFVGKRTLAGVAGESSQTPLDTVTFYNDTSVSHHLNG